MTTVNLYPGDDIQAAINNNGAGSIFQMAAGTYSNAQFLPKSNDQFIGDSNGGTVLDGGGFLPWLTYDDGATGVLLQNLTVQNYSTAQDLGAVQTGQYWTLNNDTVQWNSNAGVTLGANSVINGGAYDYNGQVGIDGYQADNAQVNGAEIAYNNLGSYDPHNNAGGLKFSDSAFVIANNNNVHDNDGMGIWGDNESVDWTIDGNTVTNNALDGIHYEVSHSAQIDSNVISGNGGAGIYISNSNGVAAMYNQIAVGSNNSGLNGGIDIFNMDRAPYGEPGDVSTTEDIEYNTIIHQGDAAWDGAMASAPYTSDPNIVFDNNTYWVADPNQTYWVFNNTTPTLYNWNDVHNYTPYEANGTLNIGTPSAASLMAFVGSPSSPAIVASSTSI